MGIQAQDGQGFIGDNKEFSVATTGEITVFFYNATNQTSVNDDTTNKNYYFDNNRSARKYVLRADKSVEITEINTTVLTDPISATIGDGTFVDHWIDFRGSGTGASIGFNTDINGGLIKTGNTKTFAIVVGGTDDFDVVTATDVSLEVDINDNTIIGKPAVLATNATDGFLYIPTCEGTPTGTPATKAGKSPIVIDTTNNIMYIYSGGAWVALN